MRRLPVLLLIVWCIVFISACDPAGILVLDPVVEAAFGGQDVVSRAMRSAGSFNAPIRSVYLEQENESSERSLSNIIETYPGAQIFLPALFLNLLEGIDDGQVQNVVVLGSDASEASYGSISFDNGAAVREASDVIAEHVQRSLTVQNDVGVDSESARSGEQIVLILADERSAMGIQRTDILLESLDRVAPGSEHVLIERYSSDPGPDELRRVIARSGDETELVVSTVPDFHGVVRNEAAAMGAQFAALYPFVGGTRGAAVAEDEDASMPAVQLVRDLETALRAGLNVDPGESRAVELEVIHGL